MLSIPVKLLGFYKLKVEETPENLAQLRVPKVQSSSF